MQLKTEIIRVWAPEDTCAIKKIDVAFFDPFFCVTCVTEEGKNEYSPTYRQEDPPDEEGIDLEMEIIPGLELSRYAVEGDQAWAWYHLDYDYQLVGKKESDKWTWAIWHRTSCEFEDAESYFERACQTCALVELRKGEGLACQICFDREFSECQECMCAERTIIWESELDKVVERYRQGTN